MPTTGNDDVSEAERLAAHAERHKDAWQQTLEDAQAMADARAEEGWETVVVPAGDTAPEPPEAGDSDRFGLVHVVPDNLADEFLDLFEDADFPVYDVYRAKDEGRVFLVTELLDPDAGVAVYVVGTFELRDAGDLIAAAKSAGTMYTHLQRLDGTHLGSFEHDRPEKFFPKYETFEADATATETDADE
ncbi:DUF7529 family protein [Halospeciosus flavus]|uniref:Uncharacterized protein n=1 Tax=Halospeciosus flavus TaxID=3032283 RepID=A0ABD5Z763_9EURY|nr:hypothetical protein [Halospeciosus flavus]